MDFGALDAGIRRVADQQIERAIQEGGFEGLPGAGQPIRDLAEGCDENWWARKWLKRQRMKLSPPTQP